MNLPSNSHPNDRRYLPLSHRRSRYCDYHSRGIYLVTFCIENRETILGKLCGNSANEAYIQPSKLGEEVLRCWLEIPDRQSKLAAQKSQRTGIHCKRNIQLLAYQLMPDHFHGIIFVREQMDIPLGQVLHGFMVGCTKAYHLILDSANTLTVTPSMSNSVISTPEKSNSVILSAYSPSPKPPLWQRGYHDRPLTRDGQLQNMIDYVHDNPRRLYLRRHCSSLFHVTCDVQIHDYSFNAVGNLMLIDNPMHAVHVRRRFNEEERRAYMNNCIIAARRGKVLISPFISEYEKQVRDVALREGLEVIQLCNEPFTDYYKPTGELFDACTTGKILLLSQHQGETSFSHRIKREECVALNAIAEDIASHSLSHSQRTR